MLDSVTTPRSKAVTAALLPLILVLGLLVPAPSAPPELPVVLTLVQDPAETVTSCEAARRELRFGWIDMDDEAPSPGPAHGMGAPVCLAVYRVGAER